MSDSSVASQEYLEWLIKILEGSQGHYVVHHKNPKRDLDLGLRVKKDSQSDTFPRKALAEEIN